MVAQPFRGAGTGKQKRFTSHFLVQMLFLADLLKNKHTVKECCQSVLGILMSPGEIEDYAEALRILPSKSTISRVALSLDAAYSLHCRKIWQEHFARGAEAVQCLFVFSILITYRLILI